MRWAEAFQARLSLVSTTPVISNSELPQVSQLEDAYKDGYTFKSTITQTEDGSLKIRGYIGIPLLSKTTGNWYVTTTVK